MQTSRRTFAKQVQALEKELKSYEDVSQDEEEEEDTRRPRKPVMSAEEYTLKIDDILKRFVSEAISEEDTMKALDDLCLG